MSVEPGSDAWLERRNEHRILAEEIEEARWRYYVLDAPTLSDADFDTADAPARGARGAGPRAAHARLAHPEGRRRGLDRVHRGRPPAADGEPRQRLLLRGAGVLVRPAGARRGRGAGAAVRAQGRRPGDQPALRGRPAGARPDPRRRPHRRGRHPQRASTIDSVPHRLDRHRRAPGAGAGRGPRRGVPAGRRLRAAQRGDGRRRQAGLRQPAQRRRRLAAPEGPAGHRDPRARHGLPRHRRPRGLRAGVAVRGVRRAGRLGAAGLRARCGWSPRLREVEAYIEHAGEHRHTIVALRDRRRRGEGRRRLPAAPARLDQPGAALGDRVQVPARGGQRPAAAHRGQHRAHRPGHAVRRDGADPGGRLDGRDGHPAQRPRGQAQGRPPRRHGRAAQGRRRDPRDRRAGAAAAPQGTAAVA